jgi:glycosyltransferase involved in cell wall biosynthesis
MTLTEHGPPDTGLREQQRVSVVIPVRAHDLTSLLEGLPDFVEEIVLVDDGSTDDASAAVRVIRPDVHVVFDAPVDGGPPLRAGFAAAHGDCVVALSAEGRVDPFDIARFVAALQAGGARWPQAA